MQRCSYRAGRQYAGDRRDLVVFLICVNAQRCAPLQARPSLRPAAGILRGLLRSYTRNCFSSMRAAPAGSRVVRARGGPYCSKWSVPGLPQRRGSDRSCHHHDLLPNAPSLAASGLLCRTSCGVRFQIQLHAAGGPGATPVPKKSAYFVHTGQFSIKSHSRAGQSSGSRSPMRASACCSSGWYSSASIGRTTISSAARAACATAPLTHRFSSKGASAHGLPRRPCRARRNSRRRHVP